MPANAPPAPIPRFPRVQLKTNARPREGIGAHTPPLTRVALPRLAPNVRAQTCITATPAQPAKGWVESIVKTDPIPIVPNNPTIAAPASPYAETVFARPAKPIIIAPPTANPLPTKENAGTSYAAQVKPSPHVQSTADGSLPP